MKNTMHLCCLIILALTMQAAFAASDNVALCNQHLDQGHAEQALKSLTTSDLKRPQALMCKGRALLTLQQAQAAKEAFSAGIALKPTGLDLLTGYILLGNAEQALNHPTEAIASYDQALLISQNEHIKRYERICYNLKGETNYQSKHIEQALLDYQAGEKLAMNDNERADSDERLAQTYQALNQLDKAIEFQLKAVMMQRKSGTLDQYAEATLTLGQLFYQQKDYAGAEKTFQRLQQFAHENGGAYYEAKSDIYLSKVKLAQGQTDEAKQLLATASQLARETQAQDLIDLIENHSKNESK